MLYRICHFALLVVLLGLTGCDAGYRLVKEEPNHRQLNMYDRTVFLYSTDELFGVASTEPKPDFSVNLFPAVLYAKQNPDLQVEVRVFGGDASRSDRTFDENSFRAESVAAFFWQQGIPFSRIGYQGFAGGVHTVASEMHADGSKLNRRVEIVFMPKSG